MEITRELKDRLGEGRACYNLGNVHHAMGKAKMAKKGEDADEGRGSVLKAIEYYKATLAITAELKDTAGESRHPRMKERKKERRRKKKKNRKEEKNRKKRNKKEKKKGKNKEKKKKENKTKNKTRNKRKQKKTKDTKGRNQALSISDLNVSVVPALCDNLPSLFFVLSLSLSFFFFSFFLSFFFFPSSFFFVCLF